ncbi:MAG: lamin tail domain-containing protein [Chloroflexi bacterium]|nr:lamin tail domain-containing protein [Chloroflexota bacterium]
MPAPTASPTPALPAIVIPSGLPTATSTSTPALSLTSTPAPAPTATLTPTPAPSPTPAPTATVPATPPPPPAPPQAHLIIQSVDLKAEVVTIVNQGDAPQDMTGWTLVSQTGSQVFRFPSGYTLPPGGSVQITSGPESCAQSPPPSTLPWLNADGSCRKSTVWNDTGDPALLYNAGGDLVSSFP